MERGDALLHGYVCIAGISASVQEVEYEWYRTYERYSARSAQMEQVVPPSLKECVAA